MKPEKIEFTVQIESGNAALVDNPGEELFSILTNVCSWAQSVGSGEPIGGGGIEVYDADVYAVLPLRDTNGNTVGQATMEITFPEEEDED